MLSAIRSWLVTSLLIFSVLNGNSAVILHEAISPERHPLLVSAASSYQLRDFRAAIRYCNAAINQLRRGGDSEDLAVAYSLLGGAFVKTGEFNKAYHALQEGLTIAARLQDAGQTVLDDLYYQLGVYYDRLGHADESLSYHQKALNLRVKEFGENHSAVAESYNGLGELYLYTVLNFRTAKTWFERALATGRSVFKEDDLELYVTHFNLAHANRLIGDHDKALTHAFRALSVIESRPAYNLYLDRCYTLLGDIHFARADFVNAIENYQLGIAQSVSSDGPANYNLVRKYTNLGVAYGESNQPTLAVACFRRSINISGKHHHASGPETENFLHMGRTYQKVGELDSARHYLRRYLASHLREYGTMHKLTGDAYRYLARYFQHTGDYDSAANYIQRSLFSTLPDFSAKDVHSNPSLETISDRYGLFQIFGDKGSILLDRYSKKGDQADLISALASFRVADTLMQLSRNSYQQEGSKLFFADHYHGIYENALETCHALFESTKDDRYIQEAFMFMEKSKAFLLAEALHKAEILSHAGFPDSLREMERNLNSAMAAYRSRLEGDDRHHGGTREDQQQIQAKIFEVTQKQERLRDTIAKMYPNYFRIKYQQLSTIADVRSYSRDNNTTVVEYFWGTDKVFLLAVSPDELIFREIQGADSLASRVRQYFDALQQPSWKENDPSFDRFFTSALGLYTALVAPALDEVRTENVILVRDGPLLLVPFESLLVSAAKRETRDYRGLDYLLLHRTISYAHSADLLLKEASRPAPPSPGKKILAVSYSRPGATTAHAQRAAVMNELPGAAEEILAISKILPGTFLSGDDATEEKFKSLAGEYHILHLAVHGQSDPEKQFSGSLFFRHADGTSEDGELHVYELYEMALKARLTVLSACESGAGKIFRGEGVFSIARGFAYAGCPTTVMTLWQVDDLTSAQIMADFYSALADGERIDQALRNAKLNYLENSDHQLAHPLYWAAYIPAGNMAPVIAPLLPINILLAVAVVFIGLAAFFFVRRRSKLL